MPKRCLSAVMAAPETVVRLAGVLYLAYITWGMGDGRGSHDGPMGACFYHGLTAFPDDGEEGELLSDMQVWAHCAHHHAVRIARDPYLNMQGGLSLRRPCLESACRGWKQRFDTDALDGDRELLVVTYAELLAEAKAQLHLTDDEVAAFDNAETLELVDNLLNNYLCMGGASAGVCNFYANSARCTASIQHWRATGDGADPDGESLPVFDKQRALFYLVSMKPLRHDVLADGGGSCCCDGVFGNEHWTQHAFQVNEGARNLQGAPHNKELFADCTCKGRNNESCTCFPAVLQPYTAKGELEEE